MAFVISGMQFWEANELSHGTSLIPTAIFCLLSAPVHIIWSTSAHLGGCQMGVEQKGPSKASLAKWKSITTKQTSFSLQSIISFPHAGEKQTQINKYSNQFLICYRQFVSFLVAYSTFYHLLSQKKSKPFHKPMHFMVFILHSCVIPATENPGYFL